MKTKSLRFQLPLSYAGIALLTALALGAVLVFTLREYYLQQERNYLEDNARAMQGAVAQMMESGLSPELLESQISSLSFLTLARIWVLDMEQNLIVDSGTPDALQITSFSRNKGLTQFFVSSVPVPSASAVLDKSIPYRDPKGSEVIFVCGKGSIDPLGEKAVPIPFEQTGCFPVKDVESANQTDLIGFIAPLGQSWYGYDLSSSVIDSFRSEEIAAIPLTNSKGEKIGSLQLSDGPSYGREIVENVALAWAVSGLLAVILAAGVGGLVSRRMAAPVLALTSVTGRMAEGDLSARAAVSAPDELAALGHSFNAMAERIEEMVSTLQNFVSDAAHELNTPLTALQTNIELAAVADRSERSELIARAQAQVERLQSLVASLLSLSRVEGKKDISQREVVNLVALAQMLAEPYASRAEQAGLTLEVELSVVPVKVLGNAAQLRRALENLLDNAIKFTPAGGRMRINVKPMGQQIILSVEDTGIGVPAEDQLQLFQRFHRGRNVAHYPGNGLGLAIVQAIAQAHGGTAGMVATAEGTCFTITLPMHPGS